MENAMLIACNMQFAATHEEAIGKMKVSLMACCKAKLIDSIYDILSSFSCDNLNIHL